jgi:gamma-glutamyltranspeptidase/glutathione hydrolase
MPRILGAATFVIWCATLVAIGGCAAKHPEWIAVGKRGMVATDSALASRIGRDVLQAGGNAVDAATAVSFALAVTRPYSTGLGGGGFLIYHSGTTGDIRVFDFRESAPAAATADMFGRRRSPRPSRIGHLAVAVPGLVAGRAHIQEQLGTMPWPDLLEPSIRLARDGFEVDADYVRTCEEVLGKYRHHPGLPYTCRYVYQTHLRGGNLRKPGEILRQPKLARLIEELASAGPAAFYEGRIADDIVETMRQRGGILTADDLREYRVIERKPLIARYREYELILMPPPSSGGVCLAEMLNILERLELASITHRNPPLAVHYVVEAMKHTFADRSRWLGDADFADVPFELLISKDYAAGLPLGPKALLGAEGEQGYGTTVVPDDAGTSHFCIVDTWGNVVVSTETINTSFGSLAAVDQWGLILNNEMDDFTTEPGRPNAYGLTQSSRNTIEPGKRPLSSMSPTIVLEDGEPVLLLGASGGPRIITSVLNVLIAALDLNQSLEQAMTRLRPHHQWRPAVIFFDRAPPETLVESLRERGHSISERRKTGIVQAIMMEEYQLMGASDPGKGGRPAGY